MFRIYRMPEKGEFFLVGGDCSQGGEDSNEAHFLSRNKLDFPIVYRSKGVAANMTTHIHPFLEWLYDVTGVPPCVGFERNNGGGSEMERLQALNRSNKYRIFIMPKIGLSVADKETDKMGWDTNTATRPKLIGEYKDGFDRKVFLHYDEGTIGQHKTFIVNKNGKPEASKGNHDDGVIAPAVCWQMYQIVKPENTITYIPPRNAVENQNWSLE